MACSGRRATILGIAVLVTVVGLAGCGGSTSMPLVGVPQDISAAQLESMLEHDSSIQVVDVRTTSEYESQHIPGSVNIPLDQLSSWMNELDPQERTVCVCASGVRSLTAAQLLCASGFRAVYNLEGGLATWDWSWTPNCPVCP